MTGKFVDAKERKLEDSVGANGDSKPFADDKDCDKPVSSDSAHDVDLLMFVKMKSFSLFM